MEHLIHDVMDLTEVEVMSATRIPERKADDKNILMIVALSNRSMRWKVLRVAKNLREKGEWRHLVIIADQKKREREKQYRLEGKKTERKAGDG